MKFNEEIDESLKFMIKLFDKYKIPYQVVGGLAAKFYGAKRPLADIDFYADMGNTNFQVLLDEIEPFVTMKPKYYLDDSWDITFMKIFYNKQKIEIGDSNNVKIYNPGEMKWEEYKVNYSSSKRIPFYDLTVNVIDKEKLIEYKKVLSREVDISDIAELMKISSSN